MALGTKSSTSMSSAAIASSSGARMPFEAQAPTVLPKLSEMSKEPFDDDIDVSCFWVSGLETPLTTMSSWLALKSAMITSSAFASSPPHRYENVISVGPSASPPPPAQPLRATTVAAPSAPATRTRRRMLCFTCMGILRSSLTVQRIGIDQLRTAERRH